MEMNSLHTRLLAVLSVLLCILACISSSRSSGDFVASLEGQLVFEDFSADHPWYALDFSGVSVRIKQIDKPELGVLSPDRRWRLLFVEEKDTNGDGIIDGKDLSSLYLERVGGSERRRINLPFPVGICAWGTESMIVACSFASDGVDVSGSNAPGSRRIIYLVDLESGKLLRRLSDPGRSSWLPTWSPDGSMIAFEVGTETESGVEPTGIQVVDTQTGMLIYEIAETSASEPAWSPDSARLAFVAALEAGEYSGATVKGMYRDVFYVNRRDGFRSVINVTRTSRFSKIPAVLTHLGGIWVSNPIWSPDGRAIASVWKRDSSEHIWVISVDGDEWAQLTRGLGHRYLLRDWRP